VCSVRRNHGFGICEAEFHERPAQDANDESRVQRGDREHDDTSIGSKDFLEQSSQMYTWSFGRVGDELNLQSY